MDLTLATRLSQIKCLAMDVDGVLTDCRVYQDSNGEWKRTFSIRDGYGIVRLREAGIKTAIITASKSKDIRDRANDLKIDYFFEGSIDKISQLGRLMEQSKLRESEIAFIGDDLFDIPVLKKVGFAASVKDAMEPVLECVHYVAERPAGNGAVREVCELLLKHREGHS